MQCMRAFYPAGRRVCYRYVSFYVMNSSRIPYPNIHVLPQFKLIRMYMQGAECQYQARGFQYVLWHTLIGSENRRLRRLTALAVLWTPKVHARVEIWRGGRGYPISFRHIRSVGVMGAWSDWWWKKTIKLLIWLRLEGVSPSNCPNSQNILSSSPSRPCSPFITPNQLSSSLLYNSGGECSTVKKNTLRCAMDSSQWYFSQPHVAPNRILCTIENLY